MKFKVMHESTNRIRVHLAQTRMTIRQADILNDYLLGLSGVRQVSVYERTCDAVISYTGERALVIRYLSVFQYGDQMLLPDAPDTGRELRREYEEKLVKMLLFRGIRRIFFPSHVRVVSTLIRSAPFLIRGLKSLMNGKLNVDVLDGLSIGLSLVRRDFPTAGTVIFLLKLGELLEEWTHKKSVDDLARSMSLNIERVWVKTQDGETLMPLAQVRAGDEICVRMGNLIPLDSVILDGEVMVNQASLTGESIPVAKRKGTMVYAGTVVTEGECVLRVEQQSGGSRYDKIVALIEQSEQLKSPSENKAAILADQLVPYTIAGSLLTFLLTRNVTKAVAVLMVDFSCALKLAIPMAVLSAMREARGYHVTVKGGKYLEAVANADTVIFDKTGTLTHACPTVSEVIAFDGREADEMLRLAACLEEHYPHSIANAVVRAAKERELLHEETHTQIEYLVAHGISSMADGHKVVIGSHHFVFEDESCQIKPDDMEAFHHLPLDCSHLYLAIDGILSAVICISDPLRPEAQAVICTLRKLGVKKIVMLTGDSERTAASIADQLGVDEYRSEVLPEDKADFVTRERAQGRTVVMIGDGINDSPALSASNVGIAISDGAAIAREIADITIAADNLFELVSLKMIANGLVGRIGFNYRFVISFNCGLIALGTAGILTPSFSALLHNISTLGISLNSMRNILE